MENFLYLLMKKKKKKMKKKIKKNEKKYFLDIIVKRIETIEHFIFILGLIKIKLKEYEKNKNAFAYIELIIKRYLEFKDPELTEESLLILLEIAIEYSPNKIIVLLERALPKFNQNYKICLKLYENYEENGDIQKQLTNSSLANLDLNNFIEFIKGLGNEEKKIQLFKNFGKWNIISRENFLNKENTNNLLLLEGLTKNKLIPPDIPYLTDNKYELTTFYENLINFNETKKVYLDTILNDDKEIKKIISKWFKLFELIEGEEEFDPGLEFIKIIEKYNTVKNIYKSKKYIIPIIFLFQGIIKRRYW